MRLSLSVHGLFVRVFVAEKRVDAILLGGGEKLFPGILVRLERPLPGGDVFFLRNDFQRPSPRTSDRPMDIDEHGYAIVLELS